MSIKPSVKYPDLELGGLRLCGDTLSPFSRVAYDFAIAAHVDDKGLARLRQKANGVCLEYHFHPLLASKFLKFAETRSPLLEEVLLCHDIREETPESSPWHVGRSNSDRAFTQEYMRRIFESRAHGESPPDSEGLSCRNREQRRADVQTRAEAVAFGVNELTFRHQPTFGDKESALKKRLAGMPDTAKIGKACDALASLFEDVHLKTRKRPDNRQRILERSQLIAEAVRPCEPKLAALIDALCRANRELMAIPDPMTLAESEKTSAEKAISAIRERYRWDRLQAVITTEAGKAPAGKPTTQLAVPSGRIPTERFDPAYIVPGIAAGPAK